MELKTYIKHKILKTQCEWESHFDNVMRLCKWNLKSFKPSNLLDVGCGDGERTLKLASHFNIEPDRVYGLEIDTDIIKLCEDRFNVETVDLETGRIPFGSDTFDIVICNQVLEHLKNDTLILHEIIRVTRIKGFIFVGIPNLAHLINRLYLMFGRQPMCIDIETVEKVE